MRAETVTKTLLEAATALTALVSARVYLDTRPEADQLPAVVYEIITDRQDNARPNEREKCTARVQVNCLARTAEVAVALREAVRAGCHNKAGTIGGIEVISCIQDGAGGDSYDPLVDIYAKPIDFIIHYLR